MLFPLLLLLLLHAAVVYLLMMPLLMHARKAMREVTVFSDEFCEIAIIPLKSGIKDSFYRNR